MNEKYIVVVKDTIIGQFKQYDQAELFQHITALNSDSGDKIHLYQIVQTIEVTE